MRSLLDPDRPALDGPSPARRRAVRRRIVLAWLWVLGWSLLIWIAGGDSFSSQETTPEILRWLRWLTQHLDAADRYKLIVVIRKSAHFIEYSILALLTFRAALISAGRDRLTTAAWAALFIVATLASADEARQAFSPTRTGSPYDVLLDITGGTITVMGIFLIARRVLRSRPTSISSSTPSSTSSSTPSAKDAARTVVASPDRA